MKNKTQVNKEFDKKFPSFLTDICPIDGKPVPIHNGWWKFVQGHDNKCLPQDIQQFISSIRQNDVDELIEFIRSKKKNKIEWEGTTDEQKGVLLAIFDTHNQALSDIITHLNSIKEKI